MSGRSSVSGAARALLEGSIAAWRAPFWLRRERLAELLAPPGAPGVRVRGEAVAAPVALGAARRMVRWLARPPLSPWRNTCLYRSVAECLVLRRYGVPAVVRLGVRNDAAAVGAILAHAWVVYPGAEAQSEYMPLAPAACGAGPAAHRRAGV